MKSILIIDTPNDCYDCPCYYEERNKCEATFKNVEDDDIEKPLWCPLRPLPKKMEVKVEKIEDIMHVEFQTIDVITDKFIADVRFETDKLIALGYNACLDEITGETEWI